MKKNTDYATCTVRIITGNNIIPKYTITQFFESHDIVVKIYAQNSENSLCSVAEHMRAELVAKSQYHVIFNWKSSPRAKNNMQFRESILRVFAAVRIPNKALVISNDIAAQIVHIHSQRHGKSPDFAEYYHPRYIVKINNYINSVLDLNIPREQCEKICQLILDMRDVV